ncbi:prepilin peptidase [Ilumatobacter sp.]|uniref:prepilin peptidase n=1 Tax=Ilumatobacter sp. TaxID=1967498 RepID=UPI003C326D44
MSLFVLLPLVIVAGSIVGWYLAVVAARVPTGRTPSRTTLDGNWWRSVVLANVVVWVLFAFRFRDDLFAALPAYLYFGAVLVLQSVIDIRVRRLPRQNTFIGIALGGLALIIAALVVGEPERVWMSGLGAIIALAIIGGVYTVSNVVYGADVAFGFGDVLLAPLLGLFLGWLNPGIVAPGLFFGFVLGSLAAGTTIVLRGEDSKSQLPFGPFLASGAVAGIFVGQPFLDALTGF